MSEFVEIRSSVADLLNAAGTLVTKGESLQTDMASLVSAIEGHEGTKTWGGDEFATGFLNNGEGGYHFPVSVGDGKKPAADAVKSMGVGDKSVGAGASNLGNYISNALMQMSGTDGASGADIGSVA